LNGETSLLDGLGLLSSRGVASVRKDRATGLLAIFGFSDLFTGGGTFDTASRRNSPDLRGGGGDGGCEAESLGDLLGSK
jgi:hypothetical protein